MPGTKKDDGTKKVAPVDQPNNPDLDKGTPDKEEGKEQEPIFGRYKSMEDAEKGFKELESKLGKQGDELSDLRTKVTSFQEAARAAAEKKGETTQADKNALKASEDDYQTKLQKIYDDLKEGDMSFDEALEKSNALTAEATLALATEAAGKRTQEILLDRDAEAAEAQWNKDHPDYAEVVKSGVLKPYIDKNPVLIDETVAYFMYKGDQKFEEGRTKAEEEAKNAAIADSVVKGPGAHRIPTRQTGSKMSEKQLLDSQLKRLEEYRAGKA